MAYPSTLASRNASADALARGLGWFSIALGLAEVLMPRRIGRASGLIGKEGLLRAYGIREIATGIGILSTQYPANRARWIWGRVAGDALDMASAASALGGPGPQKRRAAVTLLALAGVTVVDAACALELRDIGKWRARPHRDYGDRSGFPRSPEEMRGAARADVVERVPRKPEPVQPRLSS